METSKTKFDFLDEVECIAAFLPGVADALGILHEQLEHNLMIRNSYSGDMGNYLRITSAMVPALAELDRIREGLDAAVNAAYEEKRGVKNG